MYQPYPGHAPPPQKSNTWVIVLIIVGVVILLVVGVIGLLAVLGMYGARKYVSAAKTAEALNNVHLIAIDAQSAWERESLDPYLLPGSSGTIEHKFCPSATQPVPASMSLVRGRKYMSTQSDWDVDEVANRGFYCLKFEMFEPQYYQYDYSTIGDGSKTGDTFTASAAGDLNGDGKSSSFKLTGTVSGGSVMLGSVVQNNPDE